MKRKVKIHYSSIFAILFVVASVYLIHSILLFEKIETTIRYIIIGVIGVIDLLILIKLFIGKRKKKRRYVYSFFLILFTALFFFLGINLNRIYSYFSAMNKDVVYSISLATLKENKDVDLTKLKDKKIGVSTEGDNENLYKTIIDRYSLDKNNEIVTYESYTKMVIDLIDKKIDLVFLPTNFVDVLGTRDELEEYGDLSERISIVDTEEKTVTKEEVQLSGSSKDITEPVTILLIGIDSTVDGLQNADSFNGDSLIVVTFNPDTMNATMLSIPRDSYVPITCMNNVDNKITHAAAGGTNCVIKTIQNLLDIKIDYYMKINFTGVVDLVNAVGGVEVDVPYNLCEQDSKRRFGEHMVYIEQGHQRLNGEQALAYARNRKTNAQYCSKKWTSGERNDFVRAANQQIVIQAVLNEMKSFKSLDELENVLKIISKNLDTNMKEATIFSFYNIAKDILISSASDQVINIEKLYLDGTGQMIYDERSGLVLWDYILNQKSLTAVKKAMKDNLSGKSQELIKTFTYSYGENYEAKVIGKGYYGTERYKLVANLVGMKLSAAQTWANTNGLKLNIEYVEDSTKNSDTVIEQQYPEGKRIDLIKDTTMTIKVNGTKKEEGPVKVDCMTDPDNEICMIPNFVGKSKSNFEVWANKFSNVINIHYDPIESDEAKDTILSQDISGITVKELIESGKTINLGVAIEKTNTQTPGNDDPPDNPGGPETPDPDPDPTPDPQPDPDPTPDPNPSDNPEGNE